MNNTFIKYILFLAFVVIILSCRDSRDQLIQIRNNKINNMNSEIVGSINLVRPRTSVNNDIKNTVGLNITYQFNLNNKSYKGRDFIEYKMYSNVDPNQIDSLITNTYSVPILFNDNDPSNSLVNFEKILMSRNEN